MRVKVITEQRFHIFYHDNIQPAGFAIWENSNYSSIRCVTELLYWGEEPVDVKDFFVVLKL